MPELLRTTVAGLQTHPSQHGKQGWELEKGDGIFLASGEDDIFCWWRVKVNWRGTLHFTILTQTPLGRQTLPWPPSTEGPWEAGTWTEHCVGSQPWEHLSENRPQEEPWLNEVSLMVFKLSRRNWQENTLKLQRRPSEGLFTWVGRPMCHLGQAEPHCPESPFFRVSGSGGHRRGARAVWKASDSQQPCGSHTVLLICLLALWHEAAAGPEAALLSPGSSLLCWLLGQGCGFSSI